MVIEIEFANGVKEKFTNSRYKIFDGGVLEVYQDEGGYKNVVTYGWPLAQISNYTTKEQ